MALICPLLALAQTPSSVEELLQDSGRVQRINRLPAGEREAFVVAVRESWDRNPDIELASLLCSIDPWSTGDTSVDLEFQNSLLGITLSETRPWSRDFATRDCAAANRLGSYFSVIPDQQREMRAEFLSGRGRHWVQQSANIALSNIRSVDAPLLRATGGTGLRSFYPLLNVHHAAEVLVADAVFLSKTDPSSAEEALNRASNFFEEWERGSPALYVRARNGFRYHNDIVFYKNFYRAVAGDTSALEALREMVMWPALINDELLAEWLPPSIRQVPEVFSADYIDPLYFGRLFPGAAEQRDDEAFRWWRTSYDTREVVAYIMGCLDEKSALPLAERIIELDTCIGDYDTNDWRVELASFRGQNTESGKRKAERELERLTRRLFLDSDASTPIKKFRNDFKVFFQDGRWVIRTDADLSRADIIIFDSVLQE
ncbi:MAG: hypothetical protein AAF830_10115, partial [Pseudomonadota bacterium]